MSRNAQQILDDHAAWVDDYHAGTRLVWSALSDDERADLRGADLRGEDLRGADLRGEDLRGADLRGADLSGARVEKIAGWRDPDPDMCRRVAEAAMKTGALNMYQWHTCETTHCLAGWAIHLSGCAGYSLEAATSASVAGAMLLPSACHLFNASNEEAMAWCWQQLRNGV